MARTHTRRQASEALGVSYAALKDFALRNSVEFVSTARPVGEPLEAGEPELVGMDDEDRLDLLARLYAAETRATLHRLRDRRLWALTSRPEPDHDIDAALARLREGVPDAAPKRQPKPQSGHNPRKVAVQPIGSLSDVHCTLRPGARIGAVAPTIAAPEARP